MTELSSVMRNCAEARVRRTIPLGELFAPPIGGHVHSLAQASRPLGGRNPRPSGLCVGMRGFEPRTSCSQSRRAAKLRYIPGKKGLFTRSLLSAAERRFHNAPSANTLSWQANQRSQDTVHEPRRRASTARFTAGAGDRATLVFSFEDDCCSGPTSLPRRLPGDAANQLSVFLRKSVMRNVVAKSRPRARRVVYPASRAKSPETADNWYRSLTEPVHLPRRLRRDHDVAHRAMACAAPPNEAAQSRTRWFVPALTAVTLLGYLADRVRRRLGGRNSSQR